MTVSPNRVVILSGHYYASKRRAGFQWLADAYWRAGYDVIFITTQISWISWLRRDRRFAYQIFREARKLLTRKNRFRTYVWFTPWHPSNLRNALLNRLTHRAARRYGWLSLGEVENELRDASMFVFESDLSLFLLPRLKKLVPTARFVYRVSDDLRLLRNHPALREVEMEFAPLFDLVSSPSMFLHQRFATLPNAVLHPHGLEKEMFDACTTNPYEPGSKNAVYVGTFNFDYDYLSRASRLSPDVRFHVIGPIPKLPNAPNVIAYGERPFKETIPFVKFADVGLQPREYSFGAESFTDSLKILQYTYCKLPIIAPEFLRSKRANVFYYIPGDDGTIQAAMNAAMAWDRSLTDTRSIYSWDELARLLADHVRPN